MTTLRLKNKWNERIEYFCKPEDTKTVERAKKDLAEYRQLEPESDWQLEARGTQSDWHRFGI